jgi:uracil-DNA glycosylase
LSYNGPRKAHSLLNARTEIKQPVLLWNIFPNHPHESHDPFSNRAHTAAERQVTLPLLNALVGMFRPRCLVAIGRDAEQALQHTDIRVTTVRHPSYGGQSEFIRGAFKLYGVT